MPPLVCAALIVLLEGLSFGVTLPVLGYYNESLGGAPILLGLMFALVSGPKVLTNPLFGRLSDRVGRRPVLILNTLGTLTGSVLWAVSGGVIGLALSRAVTGVFSGQAGLAQAVAADSTTPERRSAAMGMLGAAFGIAFGLGPPVGGWFGQRFGYPAVGWLCAALQALSLVNIFLLLRETRPAAAREAPSGQTVDRVGYAAADSAPGLLRGRIIQRPNVLPLLIATTIITLGLSEMISTFSLLAKDAYGFDSARAGYAFGVYGLVAVLVQGGAIRPLVARCGDRLVAMIGMIALAVGFGWVALHPPLWSFWIATVIAGVGSALVVPCLTALLSQTVDHSEQGAINGLSQSATGLGRFSGNLLGGWLYQVAGMAMPYASAAGMALVALAVLLPTRSNPPESGEK